MQRNFLSSSMSNIKQNYNRKSLIDKVKTNKQKHVEEFEQARKKYQKLFVQKLEAMTAAAKEGKDVPHHIDLVKPQSFEKSYDIALNMLEMGQGETIELPLNIFAQLVHDEWEWQDEFAATASVYNSDFGLGMAR